MFKFWKKVRGLKIKDFHRKSSSLWILLRCTIFKSVLKYEKIICKISYEHLKGHPKYNPKRQTSSVSSIKVRSGLNNSITITISRISFFKPNYRIPYLKKSIKYLETTLCDAEWMYFTCISVDDRPKDIDFQSRTFLNGFYRIDTILGGFDSWITK
jgi:hypothetical protein